MRAALEAAAPRAARPGRQRAGTAGPVQGGSRDG
jgi:hypothetical protein